MKPILFSAEMVRAILDGRKTQTRRLSGLEDVNESPDIWRFNKVGILDYMTKPRYKGRFGAYFETDKLEKNTLNICPVVCPYGQPGDQLWVRETWGLYDTEPKDGPEKAIVFYKASDGESYELRYQLWRPSIFMPRWASRITLEITGVMVERLQDITPQDVLKEGFTKVAMPGDCDGMAVCSAKYEFLFYYHAANAFSELWDSINAKRGYTWDSNPWVWVVEFKKMDGEA